MLAKLSIQNYALIRSLEIEPSRALNIITGETGAGKSIMLGAVGLLLGNRADSHVLFDTESKCIIEGTFHIGEYKLEALFEAYDVDFEEETIIRREVNGKGKSRAFVNDTPCNLEFLRKLGLKLMDVHSQHETLQLSAQQYQLELIDSVAGNQSIKNDYQTQYKAYKEKEKIYLELINEGDALKKEADYHQFLFDELDQAQLQNNEQESLEEDVARLENAEEIKSELNRALQISDQSEFNLLSLLTELKQVLSGLASFSASYATLNTRIDSLHIELKDVIADIETEEGQVDLDPQKLLELQDRLHLIYKLQQKHQVSNISGLLTIYEELGNKVLKVSNLDEAIDTARSDKERAFSLCESLAQALSASRQAVFKSFKSDVLTLIKELGMPNATLHIEREEAALSITGQDKIEIKFSANKGIAPAPLKTATSGGEFSRLMFAVKYVLAGKTALPTMIFDEIDAGISGEVAIQMAQMMRKMASDHQVITISHLPQIAAKGEQHYFVYKDDSAATTASQIKLLNEDERLKELAQMIGGTNYSDTALNSARELMNN